MQLPFMHANPHFYDYLHFLDFKDDASVELVDGAGQAINTVAHGTFRVHDRSPSTAEIAFSDLVEINPYKQGQKVREIAAFTVNVTQEDGVFPFPQEVLWRIEDQNGYACLLYRMRYVFAFDPCPLVVPINSGIRTIRLSRKS